MRAYDDEPTSCTHCSVGLDFDALCDCDTDPMCIRCHRVQHVETIIRIGLQDWGKTA